MNTQTLLNNVATTTNNDAIIVNAKEFLKALKFVVTATSKKQSRPILRYIHVRIDENELTLESTDSYQLTQFKVAAEVDKKLVGKEFLIDSKFARKLSKTPTKHGENIIIAPEYDEDGLRTGLVKYADGNHELFIDDHEHYEGNYPEIDRCIPGNNSFTFNIQAKELLPTLKEIKKQVDNNKKLYSAHMEIHDASKVVLSAGDHEKEINQSNLNITDDIVERGKGLNFEIDFNVQYLIGMVQKCNSRENLHFSFSGTLRPFTFTREKGAIGLVCPIRKF